MVLVGKEGDQLSPTEVKGGGGKRYINRLLINWK